jgi:hypothetical protein
LKKLVVIALLALYMVSTTELCELLKLPFLIEHFVEHREQNNRLTVMQFLAMHYTGEDEKDADYDKDMKLPFKSHDNCCIAAAFSVSESFSSGLVVQRPEYSIVPTFKLYNETFKPHTYLSNIWQPPKHLS